MANADSDVPDLSARAALLLIDVQVDFFPGGALPVPAGDRVIPALNRAIARFRAKGRPIYASRDWHPADSTHFRIFGGPWPIHCVAGTRGAAFHPDIDLPAETIVISKGIGRTDDGYSDFEGVNDHGQSFLNDLRQHGVDRLYVGGLATDYCVRATVLDARREGLDVLVLVDGVAGLGADDTRRAFDEMLAAGATLVGKDEVDRSTPRSREHAP